jgi:Calcium-dependent channel, 7TM region, putative phosphate
MEGVVGATMSSTGFVTFLDLTSVTCAATTPLTSKPQILDVRVAPEPREVLWHNAHVSAKEILGRERFVNFLLFIGGFFWIFPLAAIQAFAKAEFIARIPGMEWVLTNGNVSNFINGYMPVVALLLLICVLPLMFEVIARTYERRKTVSDVQASMMGRYFYYQVLNIYVTVTAGSLWRSLAEIVDHPSSLLELLGSSLPSMVGYFVALLVTKILAGLPMVFLRVGALSRMLVLRSLTPQAARLSQRELDEVYRPDNVQYGWEVPTQLLAIMIVFTYAVICPVILPVGTCYFCFALIVYKKQVLYVYQPVYESGGSMFPTALQRTLFGLFCGQLTMIGYLFTRGFYHQPLFLLPLPAATIWGIGYFNRHYAGTFRRRSSEFCELFSPQFADISFSLYRTVDKAEFRTRARVRPHQ